MSDTNCSDWDFFRFTLGYDNEYMPDEYLGELFHYTSPNGFLSILNGRPDKASIWASRFDCLNDASEGTVAYTVYQDVCQELKGCGKITSELYSILIDIVPANIVKYTWLEQMRTYSEVQNKLKMSEHLFGDEIAEKVALMLASLLILIQTEEPSGDPKKRQRVYIERSNRVEKECAPRIKELLALK